MRLTHLGNTSSFVRSSKRSSTYALPIALFILLGATSCDSDDAQTLSTTPLPKTASAVFEAQLSNNAVLGFEDGVAAYERLDYATALIAWEPLAEQGHAEAQFKLGLMYARGLGIPKDAEAALKWISLAAERGHAEAQKSLGWIYHAGDHVPQNEETSVKWYRLAVEQLTLAAKQGDAEAQNSLGNMYSRGQGIPQDDKMALKWYTLAAEQGFDDAQRALGLMYDEGKGVLQNKETSVKWYRLAIEQLTLEAKQGSIDAKFELASIYEDGVLQNEETSVKWYRLAVEQLTLAAEQGHAEVQKRLGNIYTFGMGGILQDKKMGVKWYTLAADQGDAQAQFHLAMAYEYGSGVDKDLEEAIRWYRLAAEQGYESAKRALAGLQDEIDQLNTSRTLMTQAENGDPEAQASLGVKYWNGFGVEKNYVRAVSWYHKAAEQGHIVASFFLAEAYRDGRGVDLDSSECFYWSLIAQSGVNVKNTVDECASRISLDKQEEIRKKASKWIRVIEGMALHED